MVATLVVVASQKFGQKETNTGHEVWEK